MEAWAHALILKATVNSCSCCAAATITQQLLLLLLLLRPRLRGPASSLVGLRVVLVVLDPPGLEGVDEGHEGQGTHNVLQQLVAAEGAVAAVVPDHKELRTKNGEVEGEGGGSRGSEWGGESALPMTCKSDCLCWCRWCAMSQVDPNQMLLLLVPHA